jgi:hypothetical protein
MNFVWFYFTFTEHLAIAAGQLTEEFPVLASKLWGQFSFGFWGMIVLMVIALWVMVVPRLLPDMTKRVLVLKPRFALAASGSAAALMFFMTSGISLPMELSLSSDMAVRMVWVLVFVLLGGAFLSFTLWLKNHPITATFVAAAAVLAGMWLERWYIIVPTMTHPRLIPYTTYTPTLTEISLTAASLALFGLMFLVFFKLFPAVSIWEVAEGRVIEEAHSNVSIPPPEPTGQKQPRQWGFKKSRS